MISPAYSGPDDGEVEALLGDALAAADRDLANVGPILHHLLDASDPAPFSDRILAQVRAQLDDLARQLLGGPDGRADGAAVARLADALAASPQLLGHAHALALEAQLAERLAERIGLDPVAPPLIQALIASPDPAGATTAMALLAAQARFGQAHRRGEMPLGELPGELLDVALQARRAHGGGDVDEPAIRASFEAAGGRLGLLSRVIGGMGAESNAALDLAHAGVALFVTALAARAGIDRDAAILATGEGQIARLALILVGSGARPEAVERQLLALHPDIVLPEGFETLAADRAAGLLAAAGG